MEILEDLRKTKTKQPTKLYSIFILFIIITKQQA